VDRHRRLVTEAEALFQRLGLSNITAMVADGSRGLPDQAPFDRIIVTAAAEDPPGRSWRS
jgi:protein-L-isoaspartate(D-aspartate) O-methyltransferase